MDINQTDSINKLAFSYLILSLLGLILSYSQIMLFVLENGLDMALFIQQLLFNHISLFLMLNVAISAIMLVLFIITEEKRSGDRLNWINLIKCLF